MAKVQNTFIKSKMNKDLDARLLPEGEYRDARNAQISKSESAQVGNLENTLGNVSVSNYFDLTGVLDIICIGSFADELNNTVYLFFTNWKDPNPNRFTYKSTANNFIISTNTITNQSTVLVKGAFLNFSQTNLITGVNILQDLLFFTDNRNQPRVINTTLANPNPQNTNPTYYSTEDQISVAKYNPYQCMELWNKSILSTGAIPYESTMKDVSSLFLPNGGSALASATIVANNIIPIDNIRGEINTSSSPYGVASTVSIQDNLSGGDNSLTDTGFTVTSYDAVLEEVTLSGNITIANNQRLVFNPNPYFDPNFSGDPDYLEDRFARFSYRFKYVDNEYSIFAPFTQIAFIPKQDGYFMYVDPTAASGQLGSQSKNDQDESYRSTVVYFMENKVNQIDLRIPLPFTNYTIQDALKIKSIDILYKESDSLAVRVVETLNIDSIINQSAVCLTDEPAFAGGFKINIKQIKGGVQVGSPVTGAGIPDGTTVVSFEPTDPSNPVAGVLEISSTIGAGLLDDNVLLEIGDTNYFSYKYESIKPTKTLPESELIRVFDKVPVRAQAQEVAGNRVMYGNFQNKITPPASLDYNVTSNRKSTFNINDVTVGYVGAAATYTAGTTITVDVTKADAGFFVGSFISSNSYGVLIPEGTFLTSTTNNGTGAADITLSEDVTFPIGTPGPGFSVVLIFEPGANVEDNTSRIEYPNSSVKTNRNYQVGFVLSDRYGRQSSVILSSKETSVILSSGELGGSTLFSPYIDRTIDTVLWPGNSLKLLVSSPIPNDNLYNGNVASSEYNPLGWYSYKIVVKQQEQEYYNVYLPGIMASYPDDLTKEIGQTSHTVLINDNINKVPRDLTEVGPDQKQFRSSVQLIGRVQNTAPATPFTVGETNTQYYPQRTTDTVSVISTIGDLFDFNPINPPLLNYFPQFYDVESNPLIARLSTENQIGQLANANYLPAGGEVKPGTLPGISFNLLSFSADPVIFINTIPGTLENYLVTGQGIPAETYVSANTFDPVTGEMNVTLKNAAGNPVFVTLEDNVQISFLPTTGPLTDPAFKLTTPGLQYLAICETEPVESALDIFWETSTSGKISDLNAAILNSQNDPAGADITWNDNFDEGLKASNTAAGDDGFILNAPFQVVNSFGQVIQLDPLTDVVEFAAPNGVAAITNEDGENVNEANVKDYFRLINTGTNPSGFGPWQVKTTSNTGGGGVGENIPANSNYFDNIYYFYNQDQNQRQFNFTIRVEVAGQENYITKTANLNNVAPEFFTVEALNDNLPDVLYGSGGAPYPIGPDGFPLVPVRSNKGVQDIANFEFNNGAANITDPNPSDGSRALSTRDVEVIDTNFIDGFIWGQNFGSPNGDPAEIDGSPIFSLQTLTPVLNGNKQFRIINNFSDQSELMAAGIYYITLALQDGGSGLVFLQVEVNMNVELTNFNFYNKNQEVDLYGLYTPSISDYNLSFIGSAPDYSKPPQWLLAADQQEPFCGYNCQPLTGKTKWWHYPCTLFEIRDTNIGASPDQYGWYIYGLGYFDNTIDDANLCCDNTNNNGTAPSFSMVEYSQALSGQGSNQITIPLSTPITAGNHLVQAQPSLLKPRGFTPGTIAEIDNWGYPPLIHGRIAVTGYDAANYLWTYEILEGDDSTPVEGGAPGTALTGCMKLFKDVNGTVITPGEGWNYNNGPITKAAMQARVLDGRPARRIERIKTTQINSVTGDKQFYLIPATGGQASLDGYNRGGVAALDPNHDYVADGPQIIYTYHGPFNFKASPWFYVPTSGTTTDYEPLIKVWAMWSYSGLIPSVWRKDDRKRFPEWSQNWSLTAPYPTAPEYAFTPFDNTAAIQGVAEQLDNGGNSCASNLAQREQIDRPNNVDQFQFAII